MKTQVRWPARELLVHNAFNEQQFIIDYARRGGVIVSSPECRSCDPNTLGQGCHLPGESYPDFVLCLVDLLRAQGLQYLVLYDASCNPSHIMALLCLISWPAAPGFSGAKPTSLH